MASYGFEIGPGLAPWWQGSTDEFFGQQGALGPGPTELDIRKVVDAITRQRDFSNIGFGMLAAPQQGTPVATTPVGQPVPIASAPMQPTVMPSVQPVASNSAPQVTQIDSNMGSLDQPMTSTIMPSMQPMTPAVMPAAQPAAPMSQANMLNQNFMQLLQGLGLNNLFQSFQPQSVQPSQMNMFGPAPLFSNSGLFNSIY